MQLKYIFQGAGVIFVWLVLVVLCFLCDIGQRRTDKEYREEVMKYQFLDKEMSEYICTLSTSLGIDSDIVVAHLIAENPEFNINAEHKNDNGTTDLGLFQLNDRYLFTTFKDKYWREEYDIDPFNWRHNTYIAVNLMSDLQKRFESQDDAIMAYNGGTYAVRSGNIKPRTREYLEKVKRNLEALKGE